MTSYNWRKFIAVRSSHIKRSLVAAATTRRSRHVGNPFPRNKSCTEFSRELPATYKAQALLIVVSVSPSFLREGRVATALSRGVNINFREQNSRVHYGIAYQIFRRWLPRKLRWISLRHGATKISQLSNGVRVEEEKVWLFLGKENLEREGFNRYFLFFF